MQLHHLTTSRKIRKKRVGRGGKRGTTAGRGQKGQKSRAGRRMRPAHRDLILRLPKLRGVKHRPLGAKPFVIHVGDLTHLTGTVDRAALLRAGLLRGRGRGTVKILGEGTIDRALVVKGLAVSKSARSKIEKAGGKVIANNTNREG